MKIIKEETSGGRGFGVIARAKKSLFFTYQNRLIEVEPGEMLIVDESVMVALWQDIHIDIFPGEYELSVQ